MSRGLLVVRRVKVITERCAKRQLVTGFDLDLADDRDPPCIVSRLEQLGQRLRLGFKFLRQKLGIFGSLARLALLLARRSKGCFRLQNLFFKRSVLPRQARNAGPQLFDFLAAAFAGLKLGQPCRDLVVSGCEPFDLGGLARNGSRQLVALRTDFGLLAGNFRQRRLGCFKCAGPVVHLPPCFFLRSAVVGNVGKFVLLALEPLQRLFSFTPPFLFSFKIIAQLGKAVVELLLTGFGALLFLVQRLLLNGEAMQGRRREPLPSSRSGCIASEAPVCTRIASDSAVVRLATDRTAFSNAVSSASTVLQAASQRR